MLSKNKRIGLAAILLILLIAGGLGIGIYWRNRDRFPADQIGYVTSKQLQLASQGAFTVERLDPGQRQRLPRTPGSTVIQFFEKKKGEYGIILMSSGTEPASEEMGVP